MGEPRTEPSMEEILASIKRIIADDSLSPRGRARAEPADAPPPPDRPSDQPATPPPLPAATEPPALAEPPAPAEPVAQAAAPAEPAAPPPVTLPPAPHVAAPSPQRPAGSAPAPLVSDDVASASRHALSTLSAMVVRTPGADNTLDGLVREMLKPLLKEWLDQRLPDLVETLVAREIARITDKTL